MSVVDLLPPHAHAQLPAEVARATPARSVLCAEPHGPCWSPAEYAEPVDLNRPEGPHRLLCMDCRTQSSDAPWVALPRETDAFRYICPSGCVRPRPDYGRLPMDDHITCKNCRERLYTAGVWPWLDMREDRDGRERFAARAVTADGWVRASVVQWRRSREEPWMLATKAVVHFRIADWDALPQLRPEVIV